MKLEEFIEGVKNLMPCPHILPELLAILEDPDSDPFKIVDLVKLDAALTVQILTLANSAYYSFPEPCTELSEAINRIGFQELYKLVGIVLCKGLVGHKLTTYQVEDKELWEHSIATAITMEHFAKHCDLNVPLAYTLGLLADVGKIAINQVGDTTYEKVFKEIHQGHVSMPMAEEKVIGFHHARTTSALFEKWNFPKDASIAIAHAYIPMEAPEPRKLACALHIALWVVACVGFNPGRDAWAIDMDDRALGELGLSSEDIQIAMVNVRERINEVRSFLKILPDEAKAS
jgi:HD-like signal output (HDOD) protein